MPIKASRKLRLRPAQKSIPQKIAKITTEVPKSGWRIINRIGMRKIRESIPKPLTLLKETPGMDRKEADVSIRDNLANSAG